MKRFDTFGEYMFDLLFAPLKKGRRAVNQLSIFFRVLGREFDDLKTAILRVRDEANVASASEIMLPVHGQDRDMPRLVGEDIESYRIRLAMKGIISEWGGTQKGLKYVLTSLGYEQSRIEPVYTQDPERWAEFIVSLGVGKVNSIKNYYAIYYEIQRVKEGSSRLAGIVFTSPICCCTLYTGGSAGTVVRLGLPPATDSYALCHTLRAGGRGGVQSSLGLREDTAPPPGTTILRTGGVCTILSNLSKGE